MRLNGKIAIIAGAGSVGQGMGTGRATAIRFAQEGAKLLLFDRDTAALARTVELIEADGFAAESVVGDVTDSDDVARVVAAALATHGGLDIVVNNVGVVGPPGLLAESRAGWDKVFATNVTAAFLMAQAAVPAMLERSGGAFVHVSSVTAHRVTGNSAAYAYGVSKAALAHFSRILAIEFAGRGIRSNVVTPGMIDTPLIHALKDRFGWSDEEFERFQASRAAQSPTGAQGTAFDVANAVLYLASDEARFVNGHEIVVDGGQINVAPGGAARQ